MNEQMHLRSQTRNKEENPLVEINSVLLRVPTRTQQVLLVIDPQQVVETRTTLPGDDPRVGVLQGRHSTVGVDFQELSAFDAVRSIAELP